MKKIQKSIESQGFYEFNTGGNLSAYRKDLKNASYILLTDESDLPRIPSRPVTIGFYDFTGALTTTITCSFELIIDKQIKWEK